jgi:hypothetical protein
VEVIEVDAKLKELEDVEKTFERDDEILKI